MGINRRYFFGVAISSLVSALLSRKVAASDNGAATSDVASNSTASITGEKMSDTTGTLTDQDVIDFIASADHVSYAKKNTFMLAAAYNQLQTRNPLNIGAMGDSVVAGFDNTSSDVIPNVNGDGFTIAPVQWPLALQNRLREFTGVMHSVSNYGYSGDTAKYGYDRWTTKPDVSVMHVAYGINDAGGRYGATFEEYLQYLELIFRRLIDWNIAVIFHTTTPIVFNVENVSSEYFSEAARGLCSQYGVPIFDSESTLIYAKFEGVYSDGKHLNAHGYNKYGNAVSAFILSGGWVAGQRKVTGETFVSPGQGAAEIGYVDSVSALNSSSSSASGILNRATGKFTTNGQKKTFTFFMDCEYANISAVGMFDGLKISMCEMLAPSNESDIRHNQSLNKSIVKSNTAKNIIETPPYQVATGRAQASSGELTYIGCLVGRGWKTVSFTATDISQNPAIQLVHIDPCGIDAVSRNQVPAVVMGSAVGIKPLQEYAYAIQVPWIGSSASTLTQPAAASIPSAVYFPCIDGVSPYQSPNAFYSDSLPMELTITSPAGWAKYLIFRVSAAANGFFVAKIGGNNDALQPTSVTFAYAPYDESTGYASLPVDGFRASASDSGLIRINFGSTPASYYSIILTAHAKPGSASVGV